MTDLNLTGARLDWKAFQEIVPEVATGMAAVTHALRKSGVEPEIFELIKVRVSQINGCAYCIQFHLNDARKLGIAAAKLDLLAAWREAAIYTNRESTALEWAEHLTLMAGRPIEDSAFSTVATHFNEREIAFLTTAIGQINFWNRIAAPLRFTPPIPTASV
jgi:AhpD family alkylhydroperoxidase